jgi:1-acyl-sn-glycerol-3-phosphate acyltransferase
MSDSAPASYRAFRVLMRLALGTYYRTLSVTGAENVPDSGPLLITANHPNSLIDPLSLSLVTSRQIHFFAKATLFVPGARRILRGLGALPIHRRQDNPADMGKNREAFASAFELLGRGGIIGIFPEGTSHGEPRLKELKTGFARIALEAERGEALELGHDTLPALGVKIVPVGIHKGAAARFRGHLSLRVGEPLAVRDFYGLYHEDEVAGVRALVEALEARLKGLMLHLEDDEVARALAAAHALLGAVEMKRRGGAREFALEVMEKQDLAAALTAFKAREPERWNRLALGLVEYEQLLEQAKLGHSDLAEGFDSPGARRRAALKFLLLAAIAPLALLGLILHYPFYWLIGRLAPGLSRDIDVLDTSRILIGTLLYLSLFAGLGWWLHRHYPLWQIPLLLALFAVSAMAALLFFANLRKGRRRLRLAGLALREPALLFRLRRLRLRLWGELRGLKA